MYNFGAISGAQRPNNKRDVARSNWVPGIRMLSARHPTACIYSLLFSQTVCGAGRDASSLCFRPDWFKSRFSCQHFEFSLHHTVFSIFFPLFNASDSYVSRVT